MTMRLPVLAAAFLGWSLGFASDNQLSRVWSARGASVKERAAAANRAFTNGTPVAVVVGALGTNYTLCGSSARIWVGPKPEPPNTFWLGYRFGEDEVTIGTTAVFGRDLDPLSCKFTGAGYSLAVRRSTETTNRIRIGQPDGAANRGQPVGSQTNRTSAAAGPGG